MPARMSRTAPAGGHGGGAEPVGQPSRRRGGHEHGQDVDADGQPDEAEVVPVGHQPHRGHRHDRHHDQIGPAEDQQGGPHRGRTERRGQLASRDRSPVLVRPGDPGAAAQLGEAARQGGDRQAGGREGGHRDQVEPGQPGQPQRLGQAAGRDQQDRAGDRAQGGREQDGPQRPPSRVRVGEVGRRIARQEDGGVGAAQQQAAGEHDREAVPERGRDHDQRAEHADAVAEDQPGAAPGPAGDAGHQQRGRGLSGGEGAQGEAGGGLAARHLHRQQGRRGPAGGQAEAADRGGGGQQGQGPPGRGRGPGRGRRVNALHTHGHHARQAKPQGEYSGHGVAGAAPSG